MYNNKCLYNIYLRMEERGRESHTYIKLKVEIFWNLSKKR